LLHGSGLRLRPPFPEIESPNSVAIGHPETGHRVEDPACELHLQLLAYQGAAAHASTDDCLVPVDRVLDHAALTETRPLMPLAATESADGADVTIPSMGLAVKT
jgi:hypothetical protein